MRGQNYVEARDDRRHASDLAQAPLHTVSLDRASDRLAGDEPETGEHKVVAADADRQ